MCCHVIRLIFLSAVIFSGNGCSSAPGTTPVKVIVPFAPGGGSDTLARVIVREIQDQRKGASPWVIINVPGAGGTIGSRRVKNARPDGKTLLFLHDGILTAKYAGQAIYGPEVFTPIAVTGQLGMVICVAEDSEFHSLDDLLQKASVEPESVTFAANIGAPSYFMARRLEQSQGEAAFRYVQSGGGARRFADLSGGHVAASAFSVSEYLNFREGGIRALAVLDGARHPAMPDVPSAIEEGYPITYTNLQGWWAPAGTPESIVKSLQLTLQAAIESPEIQAYSERQCIDPVFLSSTELELKMKQKASELGQLELSFERQHIPPVEWMIAVCLLVGGILSWGKPIDPLREAKIEPAPVHWRRNFALAAVLIGFIASLSLPADMFLIAAVSFMLASGILTMGFRDFRNTVMVAIAAPVILFLFLSTLLGIGLP